jgi:GntR family transcriptional regulator, transcriptional repressor for pyruvate dehydrogenase complex
MRPADDVNGKLKPVSRVTLGERAAAQPAAQISEGTWHPGDRLPAESELCATLRIGRSPLREGWKSLAYVGTVQMRPGEGTYVLDSAQSLADPIRPRGILKSEKDLQDVSESRLILETELACDCCGADGAGPIWRRWKRSRAI